MKNIGEKVFRAVACPTCSVKYRATLRKDLMDKDDDGIGVILIEPPCSHKFIVFVDKNLKIRGYEKIEYEGITVEHADAEFIQKNIEELKKQHELLLRQDYNRAFQIMKEIQKAQKKYKELTGDIPP